MSDQIYLRSIEITNLGGLVKFKAYFSIATILIGENGVGKSSVLDVTKSFFEGGANYELVRRGQVSGEAKLVFTDGSWVWKKLTLAQADKDAKVELEAHGPEGELKKAPQSWLEERVPKNSFDPIAFLKSDPKDMSAFILKHVPTVFTADEVNAALDTPVGKIPNVGTFPRVSGQITLERLNEIRDTRYEERRQVNVSIRDMEGVISDLEKSLPGSSDTDWGAERLRFQDEISTIERGIATSASSIELEAEQAKSGKREEIGAAIAELRKQISAKEAELAAFLAAADKAAAEALAENTRDLEARRASLSLDLGTASANADREQQAVGIRKAIAERRKANEGSLMKETRLSGVIKALDDLKHDRLKTLPISGFDLKKDKRGRPIITIDGIALDQINAQSRLYVAIQCIQLGSGKIPVILAETSDLDDSHMAELASACKSADPPIQLIAARWVNGESLAVVSETEYAELASK